MQELSVIYFLFSTIDVRDVPSCLVDPPPPHLLIPTQQDSRSLHCRDGGELNPCHVLIHAVLLCCAVEGMHSHRLVLSGWLYFVVFFAWTFGRNNNPDNLKELCWILYFLLFLANSLNTFFSHSEGFFNPFSNSLSRQAGFKKAQNSLYYMCHVCRDPSASAVHLNNKSKATVVETPASLQWCHSKCTFSY